MQEQAPGQNSSPWRGAHDGAVAVVCGGPTIEQSVPERLHPVEWSLLVQLLKAMLELLMKNCIPWDGPHIGA